MCTNMGSTGKANIGKIGTGIRYTFSNGKTYNYYVSNDGLRRIEDAAKIPQGNLTTKQLAKKLIDSGKATFLTKNEIDNLRSEYFERRKNTPDYETGNPFHKRGLGKTVYRPRRNK